MNINKAATRLNEIWQDELNSNRKGCFYKWCAVGVADNKLYLYLDSKKLPPKFQFYGWEVIPMFAKCAKPL